MNMKEDLIEGLRRVNKALTESYTIEFTSPYGRKGIRCYSPDLGDFEIHICETREDVEASREGRW